MTIIASEEDILTRLKAKAILKESKNKECKRREIYPIERHFQTINSQINVETETQVKETKEESWLKGGDCTVCRREKYCKKECNAKRHADKMAQYKNQYGHGQPILLPSTKEELEELRSYQKEMEKKHGKKRR